MAKQVVIVGAGPGGLTAAMILARRGVKVTVLEREPHVGGRNAALELGPYRFDLGPTFLMLKHILDEVFTEAGTTAAAHLQFVRLDPLYRLRFPDLTLHPSADPARMKAEIARHFPGREAGFDRFMAGEAARFARLAPCLQQPYGNPLKLLSRNTLKVLRYVVTRRSVFDVLYDYFGDERLALAFSFQSKYLGMSPWTCPGFFAMLGYVEYAFGIYHTLGGLSEISLAMAKVARANGAEIRLGAEVTGIRLRDRRVTGVTLKGGEAIACDDLVINADFAYAMEHLVPGGARRKWTPATLARKTFSCSTFMLYLGLDKVYDVPHHTIVFAKDYRQNVADIFANLRLSDDFSFYVRNASVTDPGLAPPGHSALYVLVPVPNNRSGIDWTCTAGGFRRRVIEALAARCDLTDLEAHVKAEQVITPRDWEATHHVGVGATFNLAHTVGQMLYFRPHNRFEDLDHCYLVGGGTHPGSGLPTIYESGRIAANLLCAAHGVPFTSLNRQT